MKKKFDHESREQKKLVESITAALKLEVNEGDPDFLFTCLNGMDDDYNLGYEVALSLGSFADKNFKGDLMEAVEELDNNMPGGAIGTLIDVLPKMHIEDLRNFDKFLNRYFTKYATK